MTKELSFEEKMLKLESIVAEMEQDTLSLEASLKAYEKGMALYKDLESQLDGYREKVLRIKDSELLPFEGSVNDESSI